MESPMTASKAELTKKFIYDKYEAEELDSNDLVEIIILLFDLLGFKSISEYAKKIGKTYSGVERYSKKIRQVNQFKFIQDNE